MKASLILIMNMHYYTRHSGHSDFQTALTCFRQTHCSCDEQVDVRAADKNPSRKCGFCNFGAGESRGGERETREGETHASLWRHRCI